MNIVALMGRLCNDPELRQTQQGTSVCTFRIAVDRAYKKDGGQTADFIEVVTWKQSAEFVARWFQKGSPIVVEGKLQSRNYQDKNGNNRTAVEVLADRVSFVLKAAGSNADKAAEKNTFEEIDIATGDDLDIPF